MRLQVALHEQEFIDELASLNRSDSDRGIDPLFSHQSRKTNETWNA
jgi:hypothetical protein